MATTVTITLTKIGSFKFPGAAGNTFSANSFSIDGNAVPTPSFISSGTTAVSTNTSVGTVGTGSHNFQINFSNNVTNPPTSGTKPFNISLKFNDFPSTTVTGNFTYSGGTLIYTGTVNVNCLHGSSLVQMKEGTMRIDQIKENDTVLSHDSHGNYTYAKVEGISHCWLSFMGTDHDAIIFEKDSLGPNEPDKQLIIDPGHPMCTQKEYLADGYDALRPAGTYWEELKGDKIHTKKWTDIFVQEEPSRRYDLILEKPFNTYIANGIIVRAKGYRDHRYKQFV